MSIVPWITFAVFVVVAAAEVVHWRRVAASRLLIAGPSDGAFSAGLWVAAGAGVARCVPVGLAVWGGLTLATLAPQSHSTAVATNATASTQGLGHIVFAIDVSPSMAIRDGRSDTVTRATRAAAVIMKSLEHADFRRTRVSVVPFFTTAKPAVIDTFDPDVARNAIDGLPFTRAFKDGKTDLIAAVQACFALAKPWPAGSTSVVICSDGDTIPATGLPERPASVASLMVVGVGDPLRGSFIDGHLSRQDAGTLRQLAVRLGGTYFNATEADLPEEAEQFLRVPETSPAVFADFGRREWAMLAVAIGAAALVLLPLVLAAFDRLSTPRRGVAV